MYCPLAKISPELLLQIWTHMETEEKLNLISTSWYFRMALGKEFFETIRPTNGSSKLASYNGLAQSRAASLVKTIEYTCVPKMIENDPNESWNSDENSLITHFNLAFDLLSHLNRFSNLEKVVLKFNFGVAHAEAGDECLCTVAGTSSLVEVMNQQMSSLWRLTLQRCFEALVMNVGHGYEMKNLQIVDLPPVDCSIYWADKWREMLGELKTFSLALWGNDLPSKCNLQKNGGYQAFLTTLDWAYLFRLVNVEDLHFAPGNCGAIGSEANDVWSNQRFPFEVRRFPAVKRLRLENFYLSTDLMIFMQMNIQTLESLTLKDCAGYVHKDSPERWPAWCEFFECLSNTRLPKLKHFELSCTLPIVESKDDENGNDNDNGNNNNNNGDDGDDDGKEKDPSLELCNLLDKHPETRIFPYGADKKSNAWAHPEWEFILSNYRKGDDQVAYERLMGLVQVNKLEMPWKLERLAAKYTASMKLMNSRPPRMDNESSSAGAEGYKYQQPR